MSTVHRPTSVAPVFVALFLAALSGCAHTPPAPPGVPDWTYPEGPGWGAECQKPGLPQQSPVVLARVPTNPFATTATLSQASFVKHDQNIVYVPTLTLVPAIGASAGQTYAVAGFHFHAGNEHVIEGQPLLEMHVKTTYANGRTAVFAVLWERDDGAPADPVLTAALQSVRTQGVSVDLTPALRRFTQLPFYSYEGSLTTPPCSPGIRWYVLEHPVRTSPASISDLVNALVAAGKPANNRRQPRPLLTNDVYLVTPR